MFQKLSMKWFVPAAAAVIFFCFPVSFACALSAGDRAPDFVAPSTHGSVVLSEFREKKHVVLALYYADFTPV